MVKLDLTPIEYTEQDRHNEGCCWDYVRQLCPGGGCLCNCHATNEEILLSDCATLRRQVVTLTAQLAARDAEVARLREALERVCEDWESNDLADSGSWCPDCRTWWTQANCHTSCSPSTYPTALLNARAALAAPTSGEG